MPVMLINKLARDFAFGVGVKRKVAARNDASGKLSLQETHLIPTGALKAARRGGGHEVELTNRQKRKHVFVHQQHLLLGELEPYWQDCLFDWRVLRVTKIQRGRITVEGESDLRLVADQRVQLTDTIDGFRGYLSASVVHFLEQCVLEQREVPTDLPDDLGRTGRQKRLGRVRQHASPGHSQKTSSAAVAPLLSTRCLPGVAESAWVRQLIGVLVGPSAELQGRVDWGPERIALPRQPRDILPAQATDLPLSTRILLLVTHVNEEGVPLLWRKEDVPGWEHDEAERVFPLQDVLAAFLRRRQHLTVVLASCGLSVMQVKELQQLARKTMCTFVVQRRLEVLYKEARDPCLSESARLASELLQLQHAANRAGSNGALSIQQVLDAAGTILCSSALADASAAPVVIDCNGHLHIITPASMRSTPLATGAAAPMDISESTHAVADRTDASMAPPASTFLPSFLAAAAAAAAAPCAATPPLHSVAPSPPVLAPASASTVVACDAAPPSYRPPRVVSTIDLSSVEFAPQSFTREIERARPQVLKLRARVNGQATVLLYTNSELLGHGRPFWELLKRLPNRKHVDTIQLARADLERIAKAFSRHAELHPPLTLFPPSRTRVSTTAFRLQPDEWQGTSAVERRLVAMRAAEEP